MSAPTRISMVLNENGRVQTHIEAASGAEPLAIYTRAIDALKAEQEALWGCPVHRGPTFWQEIAGLARRAQYEGERLDKLVRYGRAKHGLAVTFTRRSRLFLETASALRMRLEDAKARGEFSNTENALAALSTQESSAALADGKERGQ